MDNTIVLIIILMLAAAVASGAGVYLLLRRKARPCQGAAHQPARGRHLELYARHSVDVVLLLDELGRIVDFNDRALATYGYSPEKLSGMSIDELRAQGQTLPHAQRSVAVDAAETGLVFESVHVRADGSFVPVEVRACQFRVGSGKYYQVIARDISGRKQSEDMLRLYGEILEHLSEGVALVRLDNRTIVYVNPGFEQMFGYGSGELLGMHASSLSAADALRRDGNGLLFAELEEQGALVVDMRNTRKDGSEFWCQASITQFDHPLYGKIALSVQEDITERKLRGMEVHQRRQEMDELFKMQVASQTASAIAHELNQPLLAIASYSEAILLMLESAQPDLGEVRRAAEGSERQAHRAGEYIRELFDFLHAEDFPIEDFDLAHEVSLIVEDARREHEWSFHFLLEVEEGLAAVHANRTHMHKMVFNLLRNSVEAVMHGRGALPAVFSCQLRKSPDGKMVEVRVQDNGPGFSEEIMDRLFEPFHTTKRGGFGMGLAISKSLAELNGGKLWAAPQEGPGAVFYFTVPIAAVPDAD